MQGSVEPMMAMQLRKLTTHIVQYIEKAHRLTLGGEGQERSHGLNFDVLGGTYPITFLVARLRLPQSFRAERQTVRYAWHLYLSSFFCTQLHKIQIFCNMLLTQVVSLDPHLTRIPISRAQVPSTPSQRMIPTASNHGKRPGHDCFHLVSNTVTTNSVSNSTLNDTHPISAQFGHFGAWGLLHLKYDKGQRMVCHQASDGSG